MVYGVELFFSLFNNLAIFIALVAIYGYLLVQFKHSNKYRRQAAFGLSFGVFAIGCMYARIPVFEGVIVDQRNAVIALSGAFGGPVSAVLSAALAGAFRVYLGGDGVWGGVVGVSLAAMAGIGLNRFPGRFASVGKAAVSALMATIIILPGFLIIRDIQTGWELLKTMTVPYGLAISLGIFLVGLLLNREEERYQVELSFREKEKKYRELIEGTQDLITHTDREGKFTFVNHVAEKILGVTPEECIGLRAVQFLHSDDRDKTEEWFNNCVAQKKKQAKIENRQVNIKTGKSNTLLWSSTFNFDDSGQFTGVGGIARDVTQIRAAEQNFENLFEKMPDGYAVHEVICDDNGQPADYRFLRVNPACERLTGLKAKDLIGRTVLEVLPGTEKYWIDSFGKIALTGESATFNNYSAEIGKHFEVTVYRPAENQVACIFSDITLRKKAEQEKIAFEAELRHAHKMEAIGTLSGGIAHDFNNILSAILGYAEIAKYKIPEESPAKETLDEVLKAGNRAKLLVRQILAFSRKDEHQHVPVKVHLVVKETIDFLRAAIPTTVQIKVNTDPGCGYILADPTQIHQVLMNLCTNASQAMEDKGGLLCIDATAVELKADELENGSNPGAYVRLSIKDTGVGIEKELLDRIFDPYFTTKEFGKGSGMGLAVVHGIVKSHDGIITVESIPGKGTTFNLFFPRIASVVEKQVPGTAPLPVGKEKILIVDDDADIAGITQNRVELLGYQATAKTSSLETLELFRSDPRAWDLVITDQTMPDMTGAELASELLAIRPDIPIIMCTGFSSKIDTNKASLIGIKAFIMKPVDNTELAKTVRQVLDAVELEKS